MNVPFRIEQRESFRVIGYCLHTTNKRKREEKKFLCYGTSSKKKIFKAH